MIKHIYLDDYFVDIVIEDSHVAIIDLILNLNVILQG